MHVVEPLYEDTGTPLPRDKDEAKDTSLIRILSAALAESVRDSGVPLVLYSFLSLSFSLAPAHS